MFDVYLKRLEYLSADHKPLWGKMTPQHMVEHLVYAIQMSNGKLKFRCHSPAERLPVLKKFLLSEKPLPKLFINPEIGTELMDLKFKNIEVAKEKLKEEIIFYKNYFDENPDSIHVHMLFGELNKSEWDVFHKKHFEHHLLQFGI